MLDAFDDLPGVALVPEPIEVLGHQTELDNQVAGEVLRLGLPALFVPEPDESRFIGPHDDPGVGTADEMTALDRSEDPAHAHLPAMSSAACAMVPVRSEARSARIPSA
jgi:hypothetical protein